MEIIIINLVCFAIGTYLGMLTRRTVIKRPVPVAVNWKPKNPAPPPKVAQVDPGIRKEEEIIFIGGHQADFFKAPEPGNYVITSTILPDESISSFLWRQTEDLIAQELIKQETKNKTKTPKKPKKNLPPKPVKRKPSIGSIDLSSL